MKGTTTIQLTDVNTGETTSIKEDNMLTNGFDFLINSAPPIYPPQYQNNFKDYFSGILLYSNKQNEVATNIYPQADDVIVGQASNDAYVGTNLLRGSFNPKESDIIGLDGQLRLVWDFSTAQANGLISSLSLTTKKGGDIGNGNELSKTYLNYTNLTSNLSSIFDNRQFMISENNKFIQLLSVDSNFRKIQIKEYDYNFDIINASNFGSLPYIEKEIDIPTSFNYSGTLYYYFTPSNNGLFWFSDGQYINPNSSKKFLILNSNYEFEEITIVNPKTNSLLLTHISNKFYYFRDVQFVIKRENGEVIDTPGANFEKMTMILNNIAYTNSGMTFNEITEKTSWLYESQSYTMWIHSSKLSFIFASNTYIQGILGFVKNTINNLAQPVTKTENQTMKIIYTLTNT